MDLCGIYFITNLVQLILILIAMVDKLSVNLDYVESLGVLSISL